MTAVTHPTRPALDLSIFRGGRAYLWLIGLTLALGAITLLWPSTPSYDPWSWLIWGRQIIHGHLWIAGGSSWKPLPVLFTTLFALFGSAQPNLWLIVARAGWMLSAVMSARLAVRITWALVLRDRPAGWFASLSPAGRLAAVLPLVVAGVMALWGTGFTPTYPVPMMLGYSEGLGFAITLIALERAWDGHLRQAFAIGLLPCLDRPELWIVWLLLGLWLIWRERRNAVLVVGLVALMVLLWVVPQVDGGGTATGLFTHPQHNHSVHSAVLSSFPFWHELSRTLWPLALERVEAAALLMMALTAWLVIRDRHAYGGWSGSLRHHGAPVAASAAATAGFLWWVGISLETEAGFAGNTRYGILGGLLIQVGGATAYGWACVGVARLVSAATPRLRQGWRISAAPALAVGSVVMTLAFLYFPGWFAHRLPSMNGISQSLRYQARLRDQLATLVDHHGGGTAVMNCGSVMTNSYDVTMVAWYLDVPIPWIQGIPRQRYETTSPGPNVVFQLGATSDTPDNLGPSPAQMQEWERSWQQFNGTRYRITRGNPITMYVDCSKYSHT
jgi:hypothetical protein